MFMRLMVLACFVGACAAPALAGPTLDRIRAAGSLACGVVTEPEDWGPGELHGALTPLDVEICKAVSVAALGEKAKVALKAYPAEIDAEDGLRKGEVEMIVGVTPSATASWNLQIGFAPPVFFDGQGILVRHDDEVSGRQDVRDLAFLAGLKVCYIDGSDIGAILQARTVARGIRMLPVPFQEWGEMEDALAVRHCDAMSADISKLAQAQAEFPRQLGGDIILPVRLTLHPAAPAYRQGDTQWARIVDWTIYSLIQAEESGITLANVGAQHGSEDPVVQRLIGDDWATAQALELTDHAWAAKVIAVVGNYGEIYDRTVGPNGSLKLPRGLNALWREGGLMHPLPAQ